MRNTIILLLLATLAAAAIAPTPQEMPSDMARYIVGLIRKGPTWTPETTEETLAIQRGHMANIQRLAESGQLVLAGPFESDSDLRGLFFFDVETEEQARQLVDTDPAVQAGRLVVDLLPWWGTSRLRTMDDGPAPEPDEKKVAGGVRLRSAMVEAACGQCQFDLEGEGCDLAIRVGSLAWFVSGTDIDEHGDAHADDGFCNAIRKARVTGHVEGDRFVADAFELIEEHDG